MKEISDDHLYCDGVRQDEERVRVIQMLQREGWHIKGKHGHILDVGMKQQLLQGRTFVVVVCKEISDEIPAHPRYVFGDVGVHRFLLGQRVPIGVGISAGVQEEESDT